MRIVVLGAGFGGLELVTRLSDELSPTLGSDLDIVLVDRREGFVFGFSKLDVMFGRTTADQVLNRYDQIDKPGVRFVRATVESIDPNARHVVTSEGSFDADVLVVALGADLRPDLTPGLLEGGHEFYSNAAAFELAETIADFEGGRVVVGVTSTPFKCPPAPSETALLMYDYLLAKGIAKPDVTLVMPLGTPIPPSPDASAAVLAAFEERGITWVPEKLVRGIDPERKVALLSDESELGFDLFLGVPVHRAPEVVVEAGLTVDGWIPVDPLTLETSFAGVYAVGDVTSVGTPKAGVFAEGQASVVADRIIAQVRGGAVEAEYDGHGMCYLELGNDEIAKVDVYFRSGERPQGQLDGPSQDLMADKKLFGSTRITRWFS